VNLQVKNLQRTRWTGRKPNVAGIPAGWHWRPRSAYNCAMTSDAFTPAARMRLAKRELLILCARIGYNP